MDNPFEIKTKEIKEATRIAVEYSMQHDKGNAINAWTNVIRLLSELKKSVNDKKNELLAIKENLQKIESASVEPKQNIGNTDYEKSPIKTLQEKSPNENKASLSYDLDVLIDRLYKGKFQHNEDKYQESVNKRADHLAKAFASGRFFNGLRTMPKLTNKKSYGEILSEFSQNSSVINNLKQKEARIEEESEIYRTLKYIRKKQKEKQESKFVGAVAKFVGGMLINGITNKVKEVVKDVKIIVKAKMAVSKTGRSILNSTTKISSDIHETTSVIKKGVKATVKVAKVGYDILGTGGKVLNSLGRAAIPAGAVFILTGGSGPIALTYLAGNTALKTITLILDDTNLSSIKFIRDLQIAHGRGLFYNPNGSLKLDSLKVGQETVPFNQKLSGLEAEAQDRILQNAKKIGPTTNIFNKSALFNADLRNLSAEAQNDLLQQAKKVGERSAVIKKTGILDTRFGRVIRGLDAVSSWAPIGALAASIFGISPVLGSLLAGSAALGIQSLADAIKGGRLAALGVEGKLLNSSLFKFLAEVPANEFLDIYQTNQWFATQIDLIKNRYKGNVGSYFKDNWNPFENSNFFKTALVTSNVLSAGGIGMTMANPVAGQFILSKLATPIANAFPGTNIVVTQTTATGVSKVVSIAGMSARGVMGASILGSLIGTGIAMLLGVPIGPAMLIGGAIGGVVGTIAGVAISAAIAGATGGIGATLSFVITTATTAIGTALGSWLGSLFDKAVGLSGGMMMNFLQGLMALFQMVSLITERFDFSNIMPIALGLITLMATLYKAGILDTSNECMGDSCEKTSTTTSSINSNLQLIKLSSFNIKILIPVNTTIDPDILSNLTAYLNDNEINLSKKFPNKDLVINLTSDESYYDDDIVIIGIGEANLNSKDSIYTAIENSIKNNSQESMSLNDNLLGDKYTFLNISN